MKKLVVLLLVTLCATPVFAVADPDPDMMGLYFDKAADVTCTTGAFLGHIPMYIIYTNPTLDVIRGFECQVKYTAADFNTSLTWTYPANFTDVGTKPAMTGIYNFICGYAVPVTVSPAFVCATADIFFLTFGQMNFYLGPADPSSNDMGLPMVLREDFSKMTVGTSTDGGVAAQINAAECGVVPNEEASFGAVKALFR